MGKRILAVRRDRFSQVYALLKYTRTFEVKELSVPLSKVEDLKRLYRIIAGDERNTAVLRPATH